MADQGWEHHKDEICRLYAIECCTIEGLQQLMARRGFYKTELEYVQITRRWGLGLLVERPPPDNQIQSKPQAREHVKGKHLEKAGRTYPEVSNVLKEENSVDAIKKGLRRDDVEETPSEKPLDSYFGPDAARVAAIEDAISRVKGQNHSIWVSKVGLKGPGVDDILRVSVAITEMNLGKIRVLRRVLDWTREKIAVRPGYFGQTKDQELPDIRLTRLGAWDYPGTDPLTADNPDHDDDASTVYSDPDIVFDLYADGFCSDVADIFITEGRKIIPNDNHALSCIAEALPDLLESFSLKLGCGESTIQERELMVFLHKFRR
ncbi:Clr5 domain-containing protein [Aspergillus undulatus]|uniref:Clr5 domain-containing protein n=1 Tax=Aspergillus undulatus TaxID=1810928 RepID=UPI003CCCCE16